MAGAERNRELKFIQTDLLQSLSSKMKEKVQTKGGEKEEEAEEIELTLGLSLNGRFASNPAAAGGGGGGGGKSVISRSSSISNFMLEKQEKKGLSFETPKEVGLGRTRSLPVETEEERRMRKEQETMRRKEVKRKRMEKNKSSVRVVREKESGSGEIVLDPNAILAAAGGMVVPWAFSSQSSVGSQGSGASGSSGVSDYETTHLIKGTGKEERSPASAQSPTQETVGKAIKAVEAVVENPPPRVPVADNRVMDAMSSIMSDMPCVSTRGQNGRRVEGFLYKYKNGRDLKIVCVCHGSFLSPAEFVKHAGGGDVENPLKHIVVSPAPLM